MDEHDDFYIKPKTSKRRTKKTDKVGLNKTKPAESGSEAIKRDKGKGKIPVKNSINLIIKEKSDIRPEIAIPAVIVILVLAALFSKFAVIDLLVDLARAEGKVSTVQAQIDADYAEISGYGDLDDRYAHYTYSGMNETELTTVSRGDILDLLREQVMPYAKVVSWSVYYNTVTMEVTDSDLTSIVRNLKQDDRVEYYYVTEVQHDTDVVVAADGSETIVEASADEDTVTAWITVYMKDVVKGAFEE